VLVWNCWSSVNHFLVGISSAEPRVHWGCCIISEERWHRACGGGGSIFSVVWVMVGIILADGLGLFSGSSGGIMVHLSTGWGRVGE